MARPPFRPVTLHPFGAAPSLRRRSPKERYPKDWLSLLIPLVVLVTGTAWLLHNLPFSLGEAGQILRHSLGWQQEEREAPPAPLPSTQTLVRGSIYDRNLNEMAVSYQFFSLFVQSSAVHDRRGLAEKLGQILELDPEVLLERLQKNEPLVELVGYLSAEQVAAVQTLNLAGISSRPLEFRYYPSHRTAGHLLGFTSEGVGLSGFEALYDPVLQGGGFTVNEAPELQFDDQEILGRKTSDVILTIDLTLQQHLEEALKEYQNHTGAISGSIIVLSPENGEVFALLKQPGFDPNYFWQSEERREESSLFKAQFFPELLQPLVSRAAALYAGGLNSDVLPALVSVPNYGLSQESLHRLRHEFALDQPVQGVLPFDLYQAVPTAEDGERLSVVQMAVGLGTLFNGGNRVMPWFLRAVYDHEQQRFFFRDVRVQPKKRLIWPAAGVHLRRKLLDSSPKEEGFVFMNQWTSHTREKGFSQTIPQEVLVLAVPREQPQLLAVLAVDYGSLQPHPLSLEQQQEQREALARRLLEILREYKVVQENVFDSPPQGPNASNRQRFVISRRLSLATAERRTQQAQPIMPQVLGLSLRKGLQRLNSYPVQISIQGSGKIVAQNPAAGTLLHENDICELLLEPPFTLESIP